MLRAILKAGEVRFFFNDMVGLDRWMQVRKDFHLGKFDHDLTVLPHWKSWLVRGIIPKMAELFRLMNYYNLPRFPSGDLLHSHGKIHHF